MKKKILAISMIASLMITGVVSATSLWGSYKGNDIIRITSNGQTVKPKDVPALSYNNRTMIPISMLGNLGVEYSWDQKNKTVDIITRNAKNKSDTTIFTIDDLVKSYGPKGLNLIDMATYSNDGNGFTQISLTTTFDFTDAVNNGEYNVILAAAYSVGASQIRLYNNNSKYIAFIKTSNYKKFLDGIMTDPEFINSIELIQNSQTQPATTNSYVPSNTSPVKQTSLLLYSNDLKVYLGKLASDIYDSDSIFNEYGTYGSKYQTKSIFNEYGTYGSAYSDESSFNEHASKPPAIVSNGKIIGYLTTNSSITDAISPARLKEWLTKQGL